MDPSIDFQKEKYLNFGFELSKRLTQAGFSMEMPAFTITWGQIARELSHILVDQGIEPDQVTDETLSDLIEGVKAAIVVDGLFQWREIIRIGTQESVFQEDREPAQEPDEGVLTESFENATRLGDEEGYWVDGGASADFFDDD